MTGWLNKTDAGVQLCWGPDDTWIACSSLGAATWSGALPEHVKKAVSGFHPVKVTLGVEHTYVFVAADGRVKWNLGSKYSSLNEILRNSTSPIEVRFISFFFFSFFTVLFAWHSLIRFQAVALNPRQEGQYFVLFKNGIWRAMLPSSYIESVSAVVNESLQKKAQLDMQIASIVSQGLMGQQQIMNNFYMNLANSF